MTDKIRTEIHCIYRSGKFDMMDIRSLKAYALEQKMYDLIVYLNNNLREYVAYIKMLNQ